MADAERLGPRLREADRQEVLAASGMAGTEALVLGVVTSAEAYTVHESAGPIAIFGVVDLGWGLGSPWLLGSTGIEEHGREFVRRSADEFGRLSRRWSRWAGFIDIRNTLHRRWISWLGADFYERVPHGIHGELFDRFGWHLSDLRDRDHARRTPRRASETMRPVPPRPSSS